MSDVTDPTEGAVSFLAILHAQISDLKTGADMHRYFELQTGIKNMLIITYVNEQKTNAGSKLQRLENY